MDKCKLFIFYLQLQQETKNILNIYFYFYVTKLIFVRLIIETNIKTFVLNNFEQIYNENYSRLYSLSVKLINDKALSKDVVQETFISYFSSLKKKKTINYPKTWLYRVTLNKCFDILKQQKMISFSNISDNYADNNTNETNQRRKIIINNALSKLNSKNKLLVLLYSEGLSYKEMSELTDIKLSSIGKTLSRTLSTLKNELKDKKDELF